MTTTMPVTGGRADNVPVPPAWAAAAKAKAERDRKSYQAFRAVDQQVHDRAHEQRLAAAVKAAEDEVHLFGEDIGGLEPEVAEALEASRAAEDRARDARAYAGEQEAAAQRIKDTGTAREVTEARVKADTADGVAAEREAAAATAKEHFDGLDKDMREARQGLEAAEHDLRVARTAAEVPAGPAPISDVTVKLNASWMQADEVWAGLSDRDRHRVRDAVRPRDMMSNQEFQAMLRGVFHPGAVAS